jgi:benzodiazapine receptor
MLRRSLKLIFCIALPLALGGIAGYFTKENIYNWYNLLNKPFFTPHNYLLAPIWVILYILMGISLFIIWQTPANAASKSNAYFVWGLQLILNFGWSMLFFYWKQIGLAVTEISILLLSIVIMIIVFYHINRKASLLQIPYLVWVFFATILNMVIWELN